MKQFKTTNILLVVLITLLTYPLLELFIPINLAGSLNRSSNSAKVESFTFEKWTNGSFQESVQRFVNDNIGLFSLFIRTHNQIEYSLFENIYTGNVVKGKENYLFEADYIKTHLGEDFSGIHKIQETTKAIKRLQDTLTAMGKSFTFVLASGKASYYPEYIPDQQIADSTNYEFYSKEFKNEEINHINCVTWFQKMKDSLGHYLFPMYGIHWSHFGAMLVTDSLVKYHEQKFNWNLPNMEILSTEISEKTKFYDNDIAHSMNLFKTVEPFPHMKYPTIKWEKKNAKHDKKRMLIIGDSFTWDIHKNSGMSEKSFDRVDFWYYNQIVNASIANDGKILGGLPVLTRHINLHKKLNDFDGVIIVSNEPNLIYGGWGIAQDFMGTILDSTYVPKRRNNAYLLEQCKSKKEWRNGLQHLADQREISLDSMIAIYLHDQNFNPSN